VSNLRVAQGEANDSEIRRWRRLTAAIPTLSSLRRSRVSGRTGPIRLKVALGPTCSPPTKAPSPPPLPSPFGWPPSGLLPCAGRRLAPAAGAPLRSLGLARFRLPFSLVAALPARLRGGFGPFWWRSPSLPHPAWAVPAARLEPRAPQGGNATFGTLKRVRSGTSSGSPYGWPNPAGTALGMISRCPELGIHHLKRSVVLRRQAMV
jgi:hypothetical protein